MKSLAALSIWTTFAAMEVVPPTATDPFSKTSCPVAVSDKFDAPVSVSEDAGSEAIKPAFVVALKVPANVEPPVNEMFPEATSFRTRVKFCA